MSCSGRASGSGSAQKAVSFVACWLHSVHGSAAPWLLVGDLNVEPSKLEACKVGIELEDYIIATEEPTYIGKKQDKNFDYALANFEAKAARASAPGFTAPTTTHLRAVVSAARVQPYGRLFAHAMVGRERTASAVDCYRF